MKAYLQSSSILGRSPRDLLLGAETPSGQAQDESSPQSDISFNQAYKSELKPDRNDACKEFEWQTACRPEVYAYTGEEGKEVKRKAFRAGFKKVYDTFGRAQIQEIIKGIEVRND